jgi:hypothetical protein
MQKKSKKVKQKNNYRYITIAFIALASITYLSYLSLKKENSKVNVSVSSKPKTAFYPTLYSDKNITNSAVESDNRFSNITFVEKESMVANAISTIKRVSVLRDREYEKGTWLWTPIMQLTPKYTDTIISGALKNGFKNIYISIDSYLDIYIMPDGEEKITKRAEFDKKIENFITKANNNGITVDAEAGWRNWAEDGNTYKALATLNYALKFNKDHNVKFRGFQYDVEPYLLDEYKENKAEVLKNFLTLVNQTVTMLNNKDLELTVVIPEFYDGSNGETPKFSYNGKNGYATEHLLSILDRREGSKIIVMSYRNFTKGIDGSIDISKDEINSANEHKTKIIIAQETGDVEPPYITFHNTNKKYFNNQKNELDKAFMLDKSYGGVAIHYINAFMDLK